MLLFFPDDPCVFHFEGAELYSACIPFSETHYNKVLDFSTEWKELQCMQVDVAVRFLKQSPQTVKGAG